MPIPPTGQNLLNQLANRIIFYGQGFDGARINISPQVYRTRDWMLQNIIRPGLTAGPIFNALGAQTGVHFGHPLFAGLPGRMFNAGPMGFYHNGGTSSERNADGTRRYIPPMYVANNGAVTFQRLIPYADRPQYARPANFGNAGNPELRQQMLAQAVRELDLVDTGRTTTDGRKIYSREGFNGEYVERHDGGIEFNGSRAGHVGSHESGVRLIRQIYYADALAGQRGGRWHHWGPETQSPGSLHNPLNWQWPEHSYQRNINITTNSGSLTARDRTGTVRPLRPTRISYFDAAEDRVVTVDIPPGNLGDPGRARIGGLLIDRNGNYSFPPGTRPTVTAIFAGDVEFSLSFPPEES